MEDQYALKPVLRQTSLFRLQNVKLMITTNNNLLISSSVGKGNFKMIKILNDYFCNHVHGNFSFKSKVTLILMSSFITKNSQYVDVMDLFLHRAYHTHIFLCVLSFVASFVFEAPSAKRRLRARKESSSMID